ncbi:partial glutamate synthase (ferredoxin), partial [Anaerolineae bacterium]
MLTDQLPQIFRERAACGTGFITHLSARPSHDLVRDALSTVARLAHRGAIAADARTGDGAGILTQIPRKLIARELAQRGITAPGDFAVGMFMLERDAFGAARQHAKQIIADAIRARGMTLLTWRAVPIDLDALGEHARKIAPHIEQAIITRPAHLDGDAFERALLLARKEIERHAREGELRLYVVSLSARTIVYKGLFVAPQLARFYLDLANPLYESALALFHQRYSTNTFPTWERAQPFRMSCHNGEINTLQGNIAWMRAREPFLISDAWNES